MHSSLDARSLPSILMQAEWAFVFSVADFGVTRHPTDCFFLSALISNGAWLARSCAIHAG
jgi:hypothetical protein